MRRLLSVPRIRQGPETSGDSETTCPVPHAAAFREAVFLVDPNACGRRPQETPRELPDYLKAATRQAARNNRERRVNKLRTHARRGDWFPFTSGFA